MARFEELEAAWEKETLVLSFGHWEHWAYKEIIELGPDVVPLLLERIPNNWFWHYALVVLTGENPAEDAAEPVAEGWVGWNATRVKDAWTAWIEKNRNNKP